MSREILTDILRYLDYLNSTDLWVSINWMHEHFKVFSNQTFPSTYQLHPACNYFRFGITFHPPCRNCTKMLCQQAPIVPTYRSCDAGIEEWVVPILYRQELLAYIRVYGYRGRLATAQRYREKRLQEQGEELGCWYGQLSSEVPSREQVLAFVRPLQYMFEALYHACQQPQQAVAYGSRELYLQSLNYIQQKYMSPLTVRTLADWQKCSPSYLQQVFRKEGNTSVHAALLQVRLERAEALLRNTQLSITHIANRCGFPDSNYFCVAFKTRYGQSPSAYRSSILSQRVLSPASNEQKE